ncbi:EpsG family protein [Actinomycetaceae bacterium L2_0104]
MLGVIALIGLVFPLGGVAASFWLYSRARKAAISSLGVAISLATVAYFYRTTEAADVYRHIEWLALYRRVPFFEAFDAGHYRYLYAWDALSWTVAHIGNPYLLQAAVTLIAYAIISYVLFDSGNRARASTGQVLMVWILVFSSIPILGIVSGMRNSLAVLICALAVYRELVQRKSRVSSLALFVVALLIHRSVIVIFVIWLVFPLLKRVNRTAVILTFVAAASITMLAPLLLGNLQGASGLLPSILAEALGSSIDAGTENSWSATQAASFNTRVNNLVSLMMIALLILKTVLLNRRLRALPDAESPAEIEQRRATLRLFSFFLIVASAAMGLMVSFVVEGDRFLTIVYLLGFVVYLAMRQLTGAKSSLVDYAIFVLAGVLLLLHVYSLVYGIEQYMIWSLVKAVFFAPLNLFA